MQARYPAGIAIAISLAAISMTAQAARYQLGGTEIQVDTTLSAGVSFRAEDADPALIGIANGGTARSVNGDDGNYGYDAWDVVSTAIKATVDADLRFGRDSGFFTRASAFYNPEADGAGDLERRLAANDGAGRSRPRGQRELGSRGHDRLDYELELLDAFYYGRFALGDRKLSITAGNQVVSWGESTFIRNGINVLNPIDVAKFRLPGSQIREALTPLPMLLVSMPLTDNLSIEALWQADWDRIEIDPRGSFFASSDIASDDGDNVVVSFGRRQDDNARPIKDPRTDPEAGGDPGNGDAQVWVPREADRRPGDETSQAGVSLRYYASWLNSTEFGLYYVNYHSRAPLLSAVRGGSTNALNGAAPLCSRDASEGCRASYFVEYPEDISLWGLSFNTNGPFGTAIQGEVSYRSNQPVQIAGAEIVMPALGVPGTILGSFAPGETITGFERVNTTQVQATVTKAFGPMFGASQWVALGEIGYTHQDLSDTPFSGPGADLPSCRTAQGLGPETQAQVLAAVSNGSCQENVGGGYATDSSWGYRAVTRLDYVNVLGALNVSPRLVFFHDVNGVSSSFNQGTRIISAGVGVDYLQQWNVDLAYTMFDGGRTYAGTDPVPLGTPGTPGVSSQPQSFATSANPSGDRDFVALSVSYAF